MAENETTPAEEPEESFELTPEEATSFEKHPEQPGQFNRGRALKAICISFAVIVGGALLFNISRENRKPAETPANERAARAPGFLAQQLERAQRRPEEDAEPVPVSLENTIPVVSLEESPAASLRPQPVSPAPSAPPARQQQESGGYSRTIDPLPAAYASPLIPVVQGSLGNRNAPAQTAQAQGQGAYYAGGYQPAYSAAEYQRAIDAATQAAYAGQRQPDPYAAQNDQENKRQFSGGGTPGGGRFLNDTSLWVGTIIPAVLITAINTDLPGSTLARVTENIYDSKTGQNLLVPQGTVLVARYNSSVSYAQRRVQIVWDTLIRPDGFLLELAGAPGVDRKGMAGLEAEYHENWFEYLKAAGIISMFSVANSKMTEEAAKYASDSAASGIAQANAEFVNELGGNIVARAMNIQPTLTVDNGTVINVMLAQNISLPPVPAYPVTRRYIR